MSHTESLLRRADRTRDLIRQPGRLKKSLSCPLLVLHIAVHHGATYANPYQASQQEPVSIYQVVADRRVADGKRRVRRDRKRREMK